MIRHLTPVDYSTMPWANGRGQTVQVLRVNGSDGSMLFRLSMASVAENGPFSNFPGVERNLTVISGPGFDLVGDVCLRADPLSPVAFPGDVAVEATGVTAPCQDFNVMTARSLPLPDVVLTSDADVVPAPGATLCLFALDSAQVNGVALGQHDLAVTKEKARLSGGPLIMVSVFGVEIPG
jgi:environmental stress-induced protein Ves